MPSLRPAVGQSYNEPDIDKSLGFPPARRAAIWQPVGREGVIPQLVIVMRQPHNNLEIIRTCNNA